MRRGWIFVAVAALHIGFPITVNITANASGCGSLAVIGHRGEPALAPEETLPSFQQAITDGARTIELDVQFTKDEVPVLMHDATVDRTTNGTGAVRGYTAAQLGLLDAGSWFGSRWTGTRVPTFDAVLALAAAQHVSVIAELKDPATTSTDLTQFLASLSRTTTPVVVESFYRDLLQDMATRSPSTPLALVSATAVTPAEAASFGHVLIVSQTAVTTAAVQGWHAAGVRVYAYTPDTVSDWRRLQGQGADAVLTDTTKAFFASCSRGSVLPPVHRG